MDPPNPSPNPKSNQSSMRVLIRPPPPIPPPAPPTSSPSASPKGQTPLPPPDPPPPLPDGVVVVGFISRRPEPSSRIINRVIDSNVFGSGNLDKPLFEIDNEKEKEKEKEEVKDWFKWRSISYYLQEDKGILYLRFCSTRCPAMTGVSDPGSGFEDHESRDLQGLLFMFTVTPPYPIILATCPTIQFEASCLPLSIPDSERKLQFSLGCRVILPPESFLTLRLPFVYGVQLDDGSLHPLNPFEHQPELTAWITKGTTLQVLSKGSGLDEGFHT